MARDEGISVRTLQRRLKAQRERAGSGELPVVEIVTGRGEGLHYRLDDDRASRLPLGLFRIGDHNGRRLQIQHAGNGRPVEKPAKSKAKFKPKGA
jgi:hypothetical protein